MSIAEVLMQKLTKEELSELCEIYDSGELRDMFENKLFPQDEINFPDKYKPVDENPDIKQST